jgi:hypothetical protein
MRTTRAGESALLLLDVVAVLQAHSVAYAVIGAMAVAVHGVVRASADADALISLAVRDVAQLADTFAAGGFSVEVRKGDPGDPIAALLALQDTFGNQVDLLIGLRGTEDALFERAVEVTFAGERVRVAGREDLIAMKLYAGGPQDLLDAQQVWVVNPATLDLTLIERLARRYGADVTANLQRLLTEIPTRN